MASPGYLDKYADFAFSRDAAGVLLLRFHTDGGPIVFTGHTHEDFPAALKGLSLDTDNAAPVVTGTDEEGVVDILGVSPEHAVRSAVDLRVVPGRHECLERSPASPVAGSPSPRWPRSR